MAASAPLAAQGTGAPGGRVKVEVSERHGLDPEPRRRRAGTGAAVRCLVDAQFARVIRR